MQTAWSASQMLCTDWLCSWHPTSKGASCWLQVLAELPAPGWAVSAADLAGRRDLRSDRVFSIDPPTARDLDDALSVQALPNGNFRVGVHIADVSHFVRCGADGKKPLMTRLLWCDCFVQGHLHRWGLQLPPPICHAMHGSMGRVR